MARINFAAWFSSADLDVALMLIDRGQESALRIHLQFKALYGSGLHIWTFGGWDSESSEYVAAQWTGSTDPWAACDFWGPVQSTQGSGGNFCGSCGTARPAAGRFCGNCGSEFDVSQGAVADIRSQVLQALDRRDEVPTLLAQLIESHALSNFQPEERALLTTKIKEVMGVLSGVEFIDGLAQSDTTRLTLADAQRVSQKVVDGEQLTDHDRVIASSLLTKAPLFFGWWGPFKALLKFLDPEVLPEQFGEAIARLDAPFPRPVSPGTDCEDLSLLARLFTMPSAATANYMRRRTRRELKNLAETRPDIYARVAFGLLRRWDSYLTQTSYAPAYVLLGGLDYLNEGSRQVSLPANQSSRRDAHPEIWNQHPQSALELIPRIHRSIETYTFARQVLRDTGVDAPPLTDTTVPLALMSTDQFVVRSGQAALATTPGCWEALSDSIWFSFLIDASTTDLLATVSGLLRHPRISSVAYASHQLLISDLQDVDVARLEAISRLYLAYSAPGTDGYRDWPHSVQADTAAVEILSISHDFSITRDSWVSILAGIPVEALIGALNTLASRDDVSPGSLSLLSDLAVQPDSDWQLELRIKKCLEYGSDVMREIAWRTADLLGDKSRVLANIGVWLRGSGLGVTEKNVILREILGRVTGEDASTLLSSVLTDSSWGLSDSDVSELLTTSPKAAPLMWVALDSGDPTVVLNLIRTNPPLLALIGESLTTANTKAMSDAQLEVTCAYLQAHPGRISEDPAFGIHLACSPQPEVQPIAISQLKAAGHMRDAWLALAESSLPLPLDAARDYLASLNEIELLSESVLLAIDSPVIPVRDFGLQMLDSRRDQLNLTKIWESLAHSDDAVVQARVIEESLVRNWDDDDLLSSLDKRLLMTRRGNRRTKEKIKERIQSSEPLVISAERIEALQDMASGRNTTDREWALQRLAQLSLAGIDLANVQVSVTNGGNN